MGNVLALAFGFFFMAGTLNKQKSGRLRCTTTLYPVYLLAQLATSSTIHYWKFSNDTQHLCCVYRFVHDTFFFFLIQVCLMAERFVKLRRVVDAFTFLWNSISRRCWRN